MSHPYVVLADAWDPHAFWFWPAGLFLLLFIIIIIFAWCGPWRRFGRWPGYGYGDPLEILRQRYARGDITKEEFDRVKAELRK